MYDHLGKMSYCYTCFNLLDIEYVALEILPLLRCRQCDEKELRDIISSVVNMYVSDKVWISLVSLSTIITRIYIRLMRSSTDIHPLHLRLLDDQEHIIEMFPPVFHERMCKISSCRYLKRMYNRKSLRRLIISAISIAKKSIGQIHSKWLVRGDMRKRCIANIKRISKSTGRAISYVSEISHNDIYVKYNDSYIAIEAPIFN